MTLVLDLAVELAEARTAGRQAARDRFEQQGSGFRERLRRGFLEIAAADPGRCAVIDAAGERQEVHRAVLAVVGDRLGLKLG